MSNAIKKAHKELQKYMAQGYTMSSAEKNLLNALGNNKELYKEFILKSNEFHDKYIHISHDISSISDSLGMQAQRESLGTNLINRVFIRFFTLHRPAVMADNFFSAIACEFFKCTVNIDNGLTYTLNVRNDD